MEALDGNAIAGRLAEVFGAEMTTATGVCAAAEPDDRSPSSWSMFERPGTVARCPTCEAIVMVLVEIRGINCVDLRGIEMLEGRLYTGGHSRSTLRGTLDAQRWTRDATSPCSHVAVLVRAHLREAPMRPPRGGRELDDSGSDRRESGSASTGAGWSSSRSSSGLSRLRSSPPRIPASRTASTSGWPSRRLFFFASLLLHELGHALQAKREGMEIEGINLWLFGVAQFKGWFPGRAPSSGLRSLDPSFRSCSGCSSSRWPQALASQMLDGVAAWLGYTNLILLAFNLLPALPLDGGRVLHSFSGTRGVISPGRHGSPPGPDEDSVSSSSRSASPCSSSKARSAAPGSHRLVPAPGGDGRGALHRDEQALEGVRRTRPHDRRAGHRPR